LIARLDQRRRRRYADALESRVQGGVQTSALGQVQLNRLQAAVSLYKALGGGWSKADTAPPASS